MSAGIWTSANILKGVAALTAAGVISGVVYKQVSRSPDEIGPDQLDVVPEHVGPGYSLGGDGTVPPAPSEPEAGCLDDITDADSASLWADTCETDRPPFQLATIAEGVWDVDSPGNPHLDEFVVAINRHHTGVGFRGSGGSYVGTTLRKEKGRAHFSDGGINLGVAEDGSIYAEFGQYGFCSCRKIKFEVEPSGDPNVMTGTWRYDDDSGMSIWRRRPPAVIHTINYRNKSADPTQGFVRDEVDFGKRPLKVERTHPLSCGNARVNCDWIWVSIFGEHFAGGQNVWMDPSTELELRSPAYLCADGSRDGDWRDCGSTEYAGDGVAGIRVQLILWEGVTPGNKILWVNGQPIAMEMLIHGYPEETDTRPNLVTIASYDANNRRMTRVTEGRAFTVEATFDAEHPDEWIRLEMSSANSDHAVVPGTEPEETESQWITLTRTKDRKVFRSDPLEVRAESD